MSCAKPGCGFATATIAFAVLAAAEEAYFSVGADVKDLPVNMWHAVPAWRRVGQTVIAATSGWVVGGGFVLVQMRHVRRVRDDALHLPEAKIGTTAAASRRWWRECPQGRDGVSSGRRGNAGGARLPDRLRQQDRTERQHVALAQEMAAKVAANAPSCSVTQETDP